MSSAAERQESRETETSSSADVSSETDTGDTSSVSPEESEETEESTKEESSVSDGDSSSSGETPSSSGQTVKETTVSYEFSDNPELAEILAAIHETQTLQLESSNRIESQNEAVISILLIILVVGLLHYIYRFFKLFF
jgi:cobalamin biosynthesis Mg chelatase CobN